MGFKKYIRMARRVRLRLLVRRTDFTVISNNCWGAEIYRDLNIPYLTPFVGLYLLPDAYLDLLENFPAVLDTPLTFDGPGHTASPCAYPVGLLDGRIPIHFMHYKDAAEAQEKWQRRRARMAPDLNRNFFKFCDREGCHYEHLKRFDELPFPHKVAFVSKPVTGLKCAIRVPHPDPRSDCVDEGPRLYEQCHRYFSIAGWLNAAKLARNDLLTAEMRHE